MCCALYVRNAGRGVSWPEADRSLPANLLATALCVWRWGCIFHQGVVRSAGRW
ncbi:hypothetical protein ACNKHU_03130 [Shigella flexneri]